MWWRRKQHTNERMEERKKERAITTTHSNNLITLTREKRLGLVNRLEFNCQLNIGYHCGRSQRRNNVRKKNLLFFILGFVIFFLGYSRLKRKTLHRFHYLTVIVCFRIFRFIVTVSVKRIFFFQNIEKEFRL